jgi:galactokinase
MHPTKNIEEIIVIAPGRTCLFGDHQDYLDLPIIACAIDRFIQLRATPNSTQQLVIKMPDIDKEEKIDLTQSFGNIPKGNFFRAAIKTMMDHNIKIDRGYDIIIRGNIAINAGTSSSSAVVVAFIKFLQEAFNKINPVASEKIAEWSFNAEVALHGFPGGRMDQYSIALGDIIYLETFPKLHYQTIHFPITGLIVGESGIPKPTIGLLQELKSKSWEAIEFLTKIDSDFCIQKVTTKEIDRYLALLPKEYHPYFEAAILNHSVTQRALMELKTPKPSLRKIAELMTEHHLILKDLLKITVPKIDAMIEAALESGAWGAKIVGSGKGGSIVVISPPEKATEVAQAIKDAGGKDAYPVNVDPGTRIVHNEVIL